MNLYSNEHSNPTYNAQRNLDGRTHYVDAGTLRYHKARILKAKATCDGLLFYLIESCAADPNGHKRIFRHVIFDIEGRVLSRPDLEHGCKNRAQAEKALCSAMELIDNKASALAAIDRKEKYTIEECARMREKISAIK